MSRKNEAFKKAERAVRVPSSITMRQARLALLQKGLLSQIDPAIASLNEPDQSVAHIEWEYAQTVERNNQFVRLIGEAISLSNEQLDELFKLAKTL